MKDYLNIPFKDITSFGQKTMLSQPLFSVSWILGRFCNYDCSYCWPYARSSTPDYLKFEVYTNAIDNIKRQAMENGFNQFHFSFSGGEPTAYKQFGELIEHYCSDTTPEYQSVHMTTNLSPGTKWWNKWINSTDSLQRRSITASYHSEFANEQEFGNKCLQLMKAGILLTINQVMVPERFEEYYERCQRFADKGINVTLKPQSDSTASFVVEGYTEDQIYKMRTGFPQHWHGEEVIQILLYDTNGVEYKLDQAERFNAFGFNKFKGWNCNAGFQSCIIKSNEVKRSYSCHDESLGTLTDGFTLFKTPSRCITPSCVSSADSKIPKVRNDYR